MRPTGSSLLPLALAALLAGLTFWLQRATEGGPVDRSGKLRHDPDFTVDGMRLRRFDTDGSLQHTLVARRMVHFPDDDSTRIDTPQLTYHRGAGTVVTSDLAWVGPDGKEVRLEGNVRVERGAPAGKVPTRIATPMLLVFPDDELARTDAPVTITQGQSVVNGTGLEANNKTQIATLSGGVRGTIHRVPPPSPLSPSP